MQLIRREPRASATPLMPPMEPFALMRNLLRWDPFRDMDFNQDLQSSFVPSFDIRETPDAYVFEADLPGIRQEDLDINLAGNRLTISGKRETTRKEDDGNYFTMERSYGSFARTFNLPDGADPSRIQAELDNGVLIVTVPKAPEVQPKKVSVKPKAHALGQKQEQRPPAMEAKA